MLSLSQLQIDFLICIYHRQRDVLPQATESKEDLLAGTYTKKAFVRREGYVWDF